MGPKKGQGHTWILAVLFFFCLRLKWQMCKSVSDSALILDGFQNEKEEETLTTMTKNRNGLGQLISLPLTVTVASVRLGCLLRR